MSNAWRQPIHVSSNDLDYKANRYLSLCINRLVHLWHHWHVSLNAFNVTAANGNYDYNSFISELTTIIYSPSVCEVSKYSVPVWQVNLASKLQQHLFSSDTPLISDWSAVTSHLQQIIKYYTTVTISV